MSLTREQFDDLVRQWQATGDVATRNRLIEDRLEMVRVIATNLHHHLTNEVELSDLEADGVFGLVDALKGYNPNRGLYFSTYATLRIRGAMLDGLRDRDTVPRCARERGKRVRRALSTFRAEHGREPDDDELRAALKLDSYEFRRVMKDQPVGTLSLDKAYSDTQTNRPKKFSDILIIDSADVVERHLDVQAIIDLTLRELGISAALLLRLKFLERRSTAECSEALRVTESCIHYRLRNILDSLRMRMCLQDRRAAA